MIQLTLPKHVCPIDFDCSFILDGGVLVTHGVGIVRTEQGPQVYVVDEESPCEAIDPICHD